jgi:hypothetical protein
MIGIMMQQTARVRLCYWGAGNPTAGLFKPGESGNQPSRSLIPPENKTRASDMTFKPGESGNPGGRPKALARVQELAREAAL